MTLPPPVDDHTRETLQETRRVFVRFLESSQPFLISNQSLQILVDEFTERLDRAVVEGHELSLLRAWQEEAPTAREEALRQTRPYSIIGRERFLPIMTQLGIRILLDRCPKKPVFPK